MYKIRIITAITFVLMPSVAFAALDTSGLEWQLFELNWNLRSKNARDATRRSIDSKTNFWKNARSMGLDIFFADSESISGSRIYSCPTNSKIFMDVYCMCDAGYTYDLLRDPPCFRASTYTPPLDCPARSSPSADGSTCVCDPGYTTHVSKDFCVLDNYEPPHYEYEPTPSYNKDESDDVDTLSLPWDVPSDAWYRDTLTTFIEKGLVNANEAFRPSENATRAEFITMVIDYWGGPRPSETEKVLFDDVPRSSAYFSHFQDAAYRGLTKGEDNCVIFHTSPCYSNPVSSINRAEAAAIINRAFFFDPVESSPLFNDNPKDAWFNIVVDNAAGHCVLQGNNGDVRPSDPMNRAEMIIMIERASKNLQYPRC